MFAWVLLIAFSNESGSSIVWLPYLGSWLLTAIGELVLLSIRLPLLTPSSFEIIRTVMQIVRLALSSLLLLFFYHERPNSPSADEESSRLLHGNDFAYGTPISAAHRSCQHEQTFPDLLKGFASHGETIIIESKLSLTAELRGSRDLALLIWAHGKQDIQLAGSLLLIVLCLQRALALLLPRQIGLVLDLLFVSSRGKGNNLGLPFGVFIFYQLLASPGLLDNAETALWNPLELNIEKIVRRLIFTQVPEMTQSRMFDDPSTSLSILPETGADVQVFLRSLLLTTLPLTLDIWIAVIYLALTFGSRMLMLLLGMLLLLTWNSVHCGRAVRRSLVQRKASKKGQRPLL